MKSTSDSEAGSVRLSSKFVIVRNKYLQTIWDSYLDFCSSSSRFHQLDRWIEREFKKFPQFGKRDREWYAERIFAAVRYMPTYIYIFTGDKSETFMQPEEVIGKVRSIPDLDIWLFVETQIAPDGAAFLAEAAKLKLDELKGSPNIQSRLLYAGLPLYWQSHIEKRAKSSMWDEKAIETFVKKHFFRAPLWLRVKEKKNIEQIVSSLNEEGFAVEDTKGQAIQVTGRKKITSLGVFKNGLVEIQDWASQQIGTMLPVVDGNKVWDACAGGGGKTLLIASNAQLKTLYASDERDFKLQELKKRADRAGIKDLEVFVWQGENLGSHDPVRPDSCDCVLVDAPCSSSGVMRRKTELRLSINPAAQEKLCSLQLKILESASSAVKMGGHLVYGTCSFLVEENEKIVESFVQSHPNFELKVMKTHGLPQMDSDTTFSALLLKCS